MTPIDHDAVCSFLAARESRPRWVGVADAHRPATVGDGYRLQAAIHDALVAEGHVRVGYKVGSTSAAGQRAFAIAEPIYAGIFAETRAASLKDALAEDLIAPSVECEIAVVLGKAIEGSGAALNSGEVLDAIETCHAACEVIDNRYGDPLAVRVPTLLADDFFHARFVLGPENPGWKALNLASLDAEVIVDGESFHASASEVLSALDAVRWLAGKLAENGRRLHPGEIVLTGSIVPPVALRSRPRTLSLVIEGFEPLTLG